MAGRRKRVARTKERSTIHRHGSRTKPRSACESSTNTGALPCAGCLGRVSPGVALVERGQISAVTLGGLHGFGQMTDPDAVVRIGWRHTCSLRRWPTVSRAKWTFAPIFRWALSYPARSPLSSVEHVSRRGTAGPQSQKSAQIGGKLLDLTGRRQRCACW